ncbi:MAG TPA: phosphate regulon sensor protein PhoR, partial [Alicycliphilus denitrificans]|nr:phosphate regulon sensor protein PhoR [Alicycliphilus denitrificans]
MPWRFAIFLCAQALGAAAGGWAAGPWGLAAGVALASWLCWGWESWQGLRVLRWLRQDGEPARAPALRGPWGEACDRMRRLLRQHGQRAAASDARLQEFLAALQASPNGVILLDAQGRIEWCNQT